MNIIRLLYIDDSLDSYITDYLNEEYKKEKVETVYNEIGFTVDNNYEWLLNNEYVKRANIIIIDSSLFKEDNAKNLFTGEEFKIIFKKFFPYSEVIIVSQNIENDKKYGIVEKYKKSKATKTSKEHYDSVLKPLLDDYSKSILELRNILIKIEGNEVLNKILVDKIGNSLSGIIEYSNMTSEDMRDLIEGFQRIEKVLKCQN